MGIREKAKYELVATDKTDKAFSSVKRSMGGITSAMGGLKTAIAGAVGVAGFGAMIKSAIDAGNKINDLNIRLGASTEALTQYQFIAKQTGVSFQTLTTAWQRQTRRISEAAQGTGVAKKALEELNIPVESLINLKPEEQFEIIAEEMSKVANQGDKVRIAMQLWDTEGVALLQTIEGGTEQLEKFKEEAEKTGVVLTKVEAEKLAKVNTAFASISASIEGVTNKLAIVLAPILEWFAGYIQREIERWQSYFKTVENVIEGLRIKLWDLSRDFEEAFGPTIKKVMGWFNELWEIILNVTRAITSFTGPNVGAPVQVLRGGRAVGGMIPQSGRYEMHEGERVISNVTNNSISINMQSNDMTPAATRAWVRNVLMPELATAATR